MMDCAKEYGNESPSAIVDALEEKAKAIHADDVAINTAMARCGADEVGKGDRPLTLLTHCNAGVRTAASVRPSASSLSFTAGKRSPCLCRRNAAPPAGSASYGL